MDINIKKGEPHLRWQQRRQSSRAFGDRCESPWDIRAEHRPRRRRSVHHLHHWRRRSLTGSRSTLHPRYQARAEAGGPCTVDRAKSVWSRPALPVWGESWALSTEILRLEGNCPCNCAELLERSKDRHVVTVIGRICRSKEYNAMWLRIEHF